MVQEISLWLLQAIEANLVSSIQRVSGELSIWFVTFMTLANASAKLLTHLRKQKNYIHFGFSFILFLLPESFLHFYIRSLNLLSSIWFCLDILYLSSQKALQGGDNILLYHSIKRKMLLYHLDLEYPNCISYRRVRPLTLK